MISIDNTVIEIIPVLRIKNLEKAENITDLSYSHVNYVRKKLNKKLIDEILVTKAFFDSQGVYGAESYVSGFSGYAVECLLIHYKSLEKMLRDFVGKNKIVIDIEKRYKNSDEILLLMNESKTKSPIVLVDPTWKERNVLAALSNETYEKIRNCALNYLKNKSLDYFIKKEFNIQLLEKNAKKNNLEVVHIKLYTDKQEGDIAGTKMKKFSRFILNEIDEFYYIKKSEFFYSGKNNSDFYILCKKREKVIKKGPPVHMIDAVKIFKKHNKNTFVEKNVIYSYIENNYSAKRFLEIFIEKYQKKVKEMDISKIEIK
jgi:tRNA nucleotidyltransferase (CCA-adding enzyme)